MRLIRLGYLVAVRQSGLGRLAYVRVPVSLLRVGRTCRPRAIREFEPRRPPFECFPVLPLIVCFEGKGSMFESTAFYAILVDLRSVFPSNFPAISVTLRCCGAHVSNEHLAVELLNRRPPFPRLPYAKSSSQFAALRYRPRSPLNLPRFFQVIDCCRVSCKQKESSYLS